MHQESNWGMEVQFVVATPSLHFKLEIIVWRDTVNILQYRLVWYLFIINI